ncbi:MAG: hypothetical protein LBM02_03655 [Lachnospiraceae bacterium]|jgi:hypothetical protein|nr:hypothetical protein [Lachnospiraceae bacterium]
MSSESEDSRDLVKPEGELRKTTNELEAAGYNPEESREISKIIHELSIELKRFINNVKVLEKELDKEKKDTSALINNSKREKVKQRSKLSQKSEIQQSEKTKKNEKGYFIKWVVKLSLVCAWISLLIFLIINNNTNHLFLFSSLSVIVFMANYKIKELTKSIKELNLSFEKEMQKIPDKFMLDYKDIDTRSMYKMLKKVDFFMTEINKIDKTNEIYKSYKSMQKMIKDFSNCQVEIIRYIKLINKEIEYNKNILLNIKENNEFLNLTNETGRSSIENDSKKSEKSNEKSIYKVTDKDNFVDQRKYTEEDFSVDKISNVNDEYNGTNVEEEIIKSYYQWKNLYESSKKHKEAFTPKLPKKMKYVRIEQNNGVEECRDEDAVVIGYQVDEKKWFLLPNPITANNYNITRFYSNYSDNCKIAKLCSYNDRHVDAGDYEIT